MFTRTSQNGNATQNASSLFLETICIHGARLAARPWAVVWNHFAVHFARCSACCSNALGGARIAKQSLATPWVARGQSHRHAGGVQRSQLGCQRYKHRNGYKLRVESQFAFASNRMSVQAARLRRARCFYCSSPPIHGALSHRSAVSWHTT
jgi:hypothetical protein